MPPSGRVGLEKTNVFLSKKRDVLPRRMAITVLYRVPRGMPKGWGMGGVGSGSTRDRLENAQEGAGLSRDPGYRSP